MADIAFISATALPDGGSSTHTMVVTLPAHNTGDLIFAAVNLDAGSDPFPRTLSAPGWTVLPGQQSFDTYTHLVIYRVMDGTEGATVTFTVGGGDTLARFGGEIAVYRNTDPANPFVASQTKSAAFTGINTGWTTTAMTTTQAGQMAVMTALLSSSTSTNSYSPAGGSQRWLRATALANRTIGLDNLITASGTSVTFSTSYGANLDYGWMAFLLTPPSVAPTPAPPIGGVGNAVALSAIAAARARQAAHKGHGKPPPTTAPGGHDRQRSIPERWRRHG